MCKLLNVSLLGFANLAFMISMIVFTRQHQDSISESADHVYFEYLKYYAIVSICMLPVSWYTIITFVLELHNAGWQVFLISVTALNVLADTAFYITVPIFMFNMDNFDTSNDSYDDSFRLYLAIYPIVSLTLSLLSSGT